MNHLPRNEVLVGDAATVLAGLPADSVDCIVTSPPYFRLRDYGVSGQLGDEDHVAAWVNGLRTVFAELARVLKATGSVWLNVGDTYSRAARMGAPPKSLLAGPERLLLALMDDGWIVRNKVVWAKANCLPHPVADRLSPKHEIVYFLTRSPDYFFDLDAIREPHQSRPSHRRPGTAGPRPGCGNDGLRALRARGSVGHPLGKNPGDVWRHAASNFRGAHFATFPEALVERPILATCPERICTACGAAWVRLRRAVTVPDDPGVGEVRRREALVPCGCHAPAEPGVVVDPFFGAGTVGVVAERLGRDWLGIELNPAYRALAERRLAEAEVA